MISGKIERCTPSSPFSNKNGFGVQWVNSVTVDGSWEGSSEDKLYELCIKKINILARLKKKFKVIWKILQVEGIKHSNNGEKCQREAM